MTKTSVAISEPDSGGAYAVALDDIDVSDPETKATQTCDRAATSEQQSKPGGATLQQDAPKVGISGLAGTAQCGESRNSFGERPVHRLKACEKLVRSLYPSSVAI